MNERFLKAGALLGALTVIFGAFAAHTRIPLADLPETELRQALGGIFANFEIGRWRGFGELFYVNNRFVDSAQSSRFIAGYAQAEYKLAPSWTVYGRLEATDATASDPYLSMFRDFPRTRQAGGVRFDVAPKHALTLEFAAAKPLDAARQRRVELQWSAAIP